MKPAPIIHKLGESDEVDDENNEDFEVSQWTSQVLCTLNLKQPSSFKSDGSHDSAAVMDIDDLTEVVTIHDELAIEIKLPDSKTTAKFLETCQW